MHSKSRSLPLVQRSPRSHAGLVAASRMLRHAQIDRGASFNCVRANAFSLLVEATVLSHSAESPLDSRNGSLTRGACTSRVMVCRLHLAVGTSENEHATPCVLNATFGCDAATQTVWVQDGCRGAFRCGAAAIPTGICGLKGRSTRVSCSCLADPNARKVASERMRASALKVARSRPPSTELNPTSTLDQHSGANGVCSNEHGWQLQTKTPCARSSSSPANCIRCTAMGSAILATSTTTQTSASAPARSSLEFGRNAVRQPWLFGGCARRAATSLKRVTLPLLDVLMGDAGSGASAVVYYDDLTSSADSSLAVLIAWMRASRQVGRGAGLFVAREEVSAKRLERLTLCRNVLLAHARRTLSSYTDGALEPSIAFHCPFLCPFGLPLAIH